MVTMRVRSQLAPRGFHSAFDLALGGLPNLLRVSGRSLADPFGLACALAFGFRADVGNLLIQPAKARFKLREPGLRLLLVLFGLFEFFDD